MQREYQNVIEKIKEQIKSGTLKVGQKLPTEREMAQQLQVGRYSIREALRVLESLGIIQSRQGSGNYISADFRKNMAELVELMMAVEQVDYMELIQVRRALELQAYETAVREQNPDIIYQLEQLLESSLCRQEDQLFHRTILRASHNQLLIQLMEGIDENAGRQIQFIHSFAEPEVLELLQREHLRMYQGIRNQDREEGIRALNRHYDLMEEECRRIHSKISPASSQNGA